MRIILFSGSHPRHLYVHRAILENFEVCGVVSMKREAVILDPPPGLGAHDRDLFIRHFQERFQVESLLYGDAKPESIFRGLPTHFCNPADFNMQATAEFVRRCRSDIAFIFGTNLIRGELLAAIPRDAVNLHLGLSPWYRGAATLFWPFYNLEPQFAGVTFHQIVPEADAGAVYHQCVPQLERGDGIHDVAAKAVVRSRADLVRLLTGWKEKGRPVGVPQNTSGRLYRAGQFRAPHLRVIYDLFQNRMADRYLDGEFGAHQPRLIECSWTAGLK